MSSDERVMKSNSPSGVVFGYNLASVPAHVDYERFDEPSQLKLMKCVGDGPVPVFIKRDTINSVGSL